MLNTEEDTMEERRAEEKAELQHHNLTLSISLPTCVVDIVNIVNKILFFFFFNILLLDVWIVFYCEG